MNERIRELYQQAHSIRHHDGDPMREGNPPTVYWQGEVSAEKFAKLIVAECISMADKEAERYSNLDQEYCSMAMDNYRELVRKHFGVEE